MYLSIHDHQIPNRYSSPRYTSPLALKWNCQWQQEINKQSTETPVHSLDPPTSNPSAVNWSVHALNDSVNSIT